MTSLRKFVLAGLALMTTAWASLSPAQQAVRVGMLPNNAPYALCDRANNTNHQGALFEIFTAVAADVGIEIEPNCDFVYADLPLAVSEGRIDVALNSTCEGQTAGLVCTQPPVTTTFTGLTVLATDTTAYTTYADLIGKAVGTSIGTTYEAELAANGITGVRLYPAFNDMVAALMAGEIQVIVGSGGAAAYRINVLNQYPGVRFVDTFTGAVRENVFLLRESSIPLVTTLNESLARLIANGTVAEILGRWSLPAI